MKANRKMTTKHITEVAMAVAALIVGGYLIYIISSQFPLPGVKYTAMAPYLSLIVAFVLTYFKSANTLLLINLVFAMVMSLMNLYMGLSIVLVGLLIHFSQWLIPRSWRFYAGFIASLYSAYVVGVSLLVSKWLIGSIVFKNITLPYVLLLMGIAFLTGAFGAHFGLIIGKRVKSTP